MTFEITTPHSIFFARCPYRRIQYLARAYKRAGVEFRWRLVSL